MTSPQLRKANKNNNSNSNAVAGDESAEVADAVATAEAKSVIPNGKNESFRFAASPRP